MNKSSGTPKIDEVLTFKSPGRPLKIDNLPEEFQLMKHHLKGKLLTVEIAKRIAEKSGTHLLKLVSPRIDGDHAILRIRPQGNNFHPRVLPSTNAPDIPFCKVLYRPLEILTQETKSVIDHILNPVDISTDVLRSFSEAFGQDVLDVLQTTLLDPQKSVEKLAAENFPIIFVPRHGGGDLQITPVSPASAFSDMRDVNAHYFQKQVAGEPRVPRGKFHKQSISAKPQNISGAIGGPRYRLFAEMPPVLQQAEAELYRYIRGGGFPRWREADVSTWILRYADMSAADEDFNNKNTRDALNRTADRLISDAKDFTDDMTEEAKRLCVNLGVDESSLKSPPQPDAVLLRRYWPTGDEYNKARRALASSHFQHRLSRLVGVEIETAS